MARTPFIEFDRTRHRYFINGAEVRSVTRILRDAGVIDTTWFDEHSRWRGSQVHSLLQLEDTTHRLDLRRVTDELRGYIRAARQYKLNHNIEHFEHVERRVVSLDVDREFAGTLDRTLFRDRRVLTDYKTNKSGHVHASTRLQTAAYGHALEPGYWWERHGVALTDDGRYNIVVYPASDFRRDLAEFYEALHNTKGDNNE